MSNQNISNDEIISQVEQQVAKTHTRQLDISFNELADMYQDGELDIAPEFQRLFRWTEEQQSRFIESLILEMPVPPIFVIEIEDGRYQLIDGLQRISSYLHFRGLLKDKEGKLIEPLKLIGCDIAHLLNDLTFDELPTSFKIRLKRSFIRLQVIRKESDTMLRYYMFKRLNTGGSPLENQEIRNCNVRLLSNEFADFLKQIAKNQDFVATIKTSEEKQKNAYLEELALRFFAYKNYRDNYKKDIEPFLDEYMERVSLPTNHQNYVAFDYSNEQVIFEKVFKIFNATLEAKSFGARLKNSNTISEVFRIYHYEAFTIGLLAILNDIDESNSSHHEKLKEKILSIKSDNEFIGLTTGGGKNTRNQLYERITFVENALKKIEWK